MANARNNENCSIFIYTEKAHVFTEKEFKAHNKKQSDLLKKSLSYIDEKDKHGLRLVNQIIDMITSPEMDRIIASGHLKTNYEYWKALAEDRRLGTIIDTMENDIDYITKRLDVIDELNKK